MGNFNRDNRRSGGGGGGFNRGFGGGRSFEGGKKFGGGGRDGGRPTMHQATCSDCNASCEVPFRPTGSRPVFCNNCFDKQGGGGGGRPSKFGGERRERPRFEDKQMHEALCAKCGKDCQVPFRPTEGKPVFCKDCFEKGGSQNVGGGVRKDSGEVMEQIRMLNTKVDKLIKMLTPNVPVEVIKKPEVKEKITTKEDEKEKTKIKATPKKVSVKKKK